MVLSKYVGASVKRREDPRLITGSSVYVDDLKLAGTVHVAFVRSPYAHARIKGIDGSVALATPGVVAVVTAADLAKVLKGKYSGETGGGGPTAEGGGMAEPSSIPVPGVEPLAMKKVRYAVVGAGWISQSAFMPGLEQTGSRTQ